MNTNQILKAEEKAFDAMIAGQVIDFVKANDVSAMTDLELAKSVLEANGYFADECRVDVWTWTIKDMRDAGINF